MLDLINLINFHDLIIPARVLWQILWCYCESFRKKTWVFFVSTLLQIKMLLCSSGGMQEGGRQKQSSLLSRCAPLILKPLCIDNSVMYTCKQFVTLMQKAKSKGNGDKMAAHLFLSLSHSLARSPFFFFFSFCSRKFPSEHSLLLRQKKKDPRYKKNKIAHNYLRDRKLH